MIWQMHHQFMDGSTEFCAQAEINSLEEMNKFIEDVKKSHPLPKDAIYLMMNQGDPRFVVETRQNPHP